MLGDFLDGGCGDGGNAISRAASRFLSNEGKFHEAAQPPPDEAFFGRGADDVGPSPADAAMDRFNPFTDLSEFDSFHSAAPGLLRPDAVDHALHVLTLGGDLRQLDITDGERATALRHHHHALQRPRVHAPPDAWASEYSAFEAPAQAPRALPPPPAEWTAEFARSLERGDAAGQRDWAAEYSESEMESAWAQQAAGAELAEEYLTKDGGGTATSEELRDLARRIAGIDDEKLQSTQFMQLMRDIGAGRVSVGDGELRALQGDIDEDEAHMQQWLREYERFEHDAGALGFSPAEGYIFQADNPYAAHERPAELGRELFARGDMAEAALCFEAALQREAGAPAVVQAELWALLGNAHAENDRDDRAIAALGEAVKADPRDLDAVIALAVSCVNEGFKERALSLLRQWIETHPEYAPVAAGARSGAEWASEFERTYNHDNMHSEVREMYLRVVRSDPSRADPAVQTAMGLLFNLSHEYDKAADCFAAALEERSEDYLLLNKLAATLANSNRSEEAIPLYFRALSIKPTYVRARANLGISFMNLDRLEEAAQQFLHCLALQPTAQHIWHNLQNTFAKMDREDLLERSWNYDVEEFRGEFHF